MDLFQSLCSHCCQSKDLEHYDCLWLHVNAVGRVFLGYGMVAVQDLPLLPCYPPGVDVFTGLLDLGLEH